MHLANFKLICIQICLLLVLTSVIQAAPASGEPAYMEPSRLRRVARATGGFVKGLITAPLEAAGHALTSIYHFVPNPLGSPRIEAGKGLMSIGRAVASPFYEPYKEAHNAFYKDEIRSGDKMHLGSLHDGRESNSNRQQLFKYITLLKLDPQLAKAYRSKLKAIDVNDDVAKGYENNLLAVNDLNKQISQVTDKDKLQSLKTKLYKLDPMDLIKFKTGFNEIQAELKPANQIPSVEIHHAPRVASGLRLGTSPVNEDATSQAGQDNARNTMETRIPKITDWTKMPTDQVPPLHRLVLTDGDLMEQLDEKSVNTIDKFGNTPLDYAIMKKDDKLIQLLVDNGANMHLIKPGSSKTIYQEHWKVLRDYEPHPLTDKMDSKDMRARIEMHNDPNLLPYLHRSTMLKDDHSLFNELTSRKDINFNRRASQTGETALHQAIISKSPKFILQSLADKTNLNIRDYKGNTVLHTALENRNVEAIKILLPKVKNVNVKNYYGKNPLHLLVESDKIKDAEKTAILNDLLTKGAKTNSLDILNLRPIDYFKGDKQKESQFYEKLRENTAFPDTKSKNAFDIVGNRPVFYNLYDSDLIGPNSARINSILKPIGFGMHHGSLEIDTGRNGQELHYIGEVAKHENEDIMKTAYTKKFYKKMVVGQIPRNVFSDREINSRIKEILTKQTTRFNPESYNKFNNNCIEFTVCLREDLNEHFGPNSVKSIPNNYLKLQKVTTTLVPRPRTAPKEPLQAK